MVSMKEIGHFISKCLCTTKMPVFLNTYGFFFIIDVIKQLLIIKALLRNLKSSCPHGNEETYTIVLSIDIIRRASKHNYHDYLR